MALFCMVSPCLDSTQLYLHLVSEIVFFFLYPLSVDGCHSDAAQRYIDVIFNAADTGTLIILHFML